MTPGFLHLRRVASPIAAMLLGLLLTNVGHGQTVLPRPTIYGLFPAGGQAGQTTEVRITEQSELEEADGLIFNHPGITAKPKMTDPDRFYPEPRLVPNHFLVSIANETPPGIYEVRATLGGAVSNVRRFVVGDAPEIIEQEDNSDIDKANLIEIGQTVNGLFAVDYDYFRFSASQGQRLIIDCLAERIDSRGDPVLAVMAADGRELARNHDTVGRDPMIDFTVPADGEYLIRLNELSYTTTGGNGTAPYRLNVSTRPWIDYVQPPLAIRGQETEFTLFGRNLGGQPSGVKVGGIEIEQVVVKLRPDVDPQQESAPADVVLGPETATTDIFVYRHSVDGKQSNAVCIPLTELPPVAEQEPNEKLAESQEIETPADILGYFDHPGDVDGYVFRATQGEKLWIEVQSQRVGFPTDPLLVIQQLQESSDGTLTSRDLNTTDDQPTKGNFRMTLTTADPMLAFEAPADGKYRILVRDQFSYAGRARPPYYHLSVQPLKPDFRIVAVASLDLSTNTNNNQVLQPRSCIVRPGGSVEIALIADRLGGFEGQIEVRLQSLPPGITAEPAVIGPANLLGSLTIQAAADAKSWHGEVPLVASARLPTGEVSRRVQPVEMLAASTNTGPTPARRTAGLLLAIDDRLQIPARLETDSGHLRMARGGKLEVPVRFVKQAADFKGNVSAAVVGLPPRVNQSAASISDSKSEGKITLDILQDVEPGKYTIFFRGDVDFDFRRRLDLAERAKEDQTRIIKVVDELNKAYTKSVQDRQAADRLLQTTTQAQSVANSADTQASQAAQQAQQQAEQAAKALAVAKSAMEEAEKRREDAEKKLAAATDDAAKTAAQNALTQIVQQVATAKTAFDNAARQANETAAKAKQADEAAADAKKKLEQATAAMKEAETARKAAMEAEAQALADRDLGNRKRQEIDNVLRQADAVARQRKIKVPIHSPSMLLEILPYPGELTINGPQYKIAAGSEVEIVAKIDREFEFQDEVSFAIQPPSGISGWSLSSNAKIERQQNEGRFPLQIAANAKPGEYDAELIARMRFNNRPLEERLLVRVVVTPAAGQDGG